MSWSKFKNLEMKLVALGLSRYEADAYLTVMVYGRLPAQRLAELTDIPKTKIYQVCGSLVEKGMLFEERELEVIYIAPPPGEAIRNFLRWRSKTESVKSINLEKLARSLAKLDVKIPPVEVENPFVIPYVGTAQIQAKIEELSESSENIVVALSVPFSHFFALCEKGAAKKVFATSTVAKIIKPKSKTPVVVCDDIPADMALINGKVYILNMSSSPQVLWEIVDPDMVEFFSLAMPQG